MNKFAILGAGSFGIALCKLISNNENCEVVLWSALENEIYDLINNGESKKYLPGIKLDNKRIKLTTNLNDICDCDFIIIAVASKFVRKISKLIKNYLNDNCIVINIAKGLEENSFKRMSEVIIDEIGTKHSIVSLTGPSHAEEIARFIPTTVVAASINLKAAEKIQNILSSSYFRIYISNDIIGAELGGALKNIIALAAGICDGLNLGSNTIAALMTRGIVEISRLGVKLGAKNQTFVGLSGIGDLIVTCNSAHSRNRKAGILIGMGENVENAIKKVGMVVEGYFATNVAFNLAKKLKVSMPITNELYEILYHGKNAKEAIYNLMNRPIKHEYEKS